MLSNNHFPKLKLGISSCLLGNEVRYDGGHKNNQYIQHTLTRFLDFQTFCPEVAIGMGVPRPPIKLVQKSEADETKTYAVDAKNNELDYTTDLTEYAQKVAKTYLSDISGYIFKKNSPSCGMERVNVYSPEGQLLHKDGTGIYAQVIKEYFPHMPMEEEGRLNDVNLRESFLTRVYLYNDWQLILKEGITARDLVEFHAQQKYLFMAYNQQLARKLGQMVATAGSQDINKLAENYIALAMQVLKKQPNRKRHTNALQHIMGYLKKQLDNTDRQELLHSIMSFQKGEIPLIMPLTLLKHHFAKHPNEYIAKQRYLSPFPVELR
ncbi:MAG: hypothetical protein CR955_00615 [Thiotrichales bacterium]|nr:MAG: hypothetical protein CR955_00615 [Thiotrichales bacterium]